MLDKLYFWKGGGNGSLSSSGGGGRSGLNLLLIILVLLGLMAAGAGGYWYYYIYTPEKERQAEQEAVIAQIKADISSVNSFYQTALDGISIPQTISLFEEINRGIFPLRLAFIGDKFGYTCDTSKCNFSMQLDEGNIATYPVVNMWGKDYKASAFLPKKGQAGYGFQYTNVSIKREPNEFLNAYKAKKPVELFPCREIISYITSYNSFLGKKPPMGGAVKLMKNPATTVQELEKKLGAQAFSFGLLSGAWEIEVKGDESSADSAMINMLITLYKQPYRSAFLIRKIDSTDKGIKVSGGLVCKA